MGEPCERIEPRLSAFVDGALTSPERVAVRTHLRVCPDCSGLVDELRRIRAAVRSLPVRHLPRDLLAAESLRRRWETTGRPLTPVPPSPRTRRIAAAAGGVAAVAMTLGLIAAAGHPRTVTVPVGDLATAHVRHIGGSAVSAPLPPPEGGDE